MYYKELARRLRRRYLDSLGNVVLQKPADVYSDCNHAATAITNLMKYKDAIDRMGEFGKLFLQYSGCPRGIIGEAGYVEAGDVIERAKESVMHYEPITDVDGNVWRPVLEDDLQLLIRCMTERAEKAEEERDAAVSDIETILAYGDVNLDTCQYCKNGQCYARGGTKPCFPKWRGAKEG